MRERWLPAALVVGLFLPQPAAKPAARPEKVYSQSPATWFEAAWMKASVSPDGRWAIFSGRGWVQLVELATGREDPERLLGGLKSVSDAVFLPDGQMARLGQSGAERGWFVPAGKELRLSLLPGDAVPQWSPDGRHVAFYRAGEPEAGVFIGTPQEYKQHRLDGRATGLAWSPWGGAVYALLYQPDGISSLVRLILKSGEVEPIARNLDAPFRLNSIGVAPDGKHLYLALAGASVPDPEARHEPEADRDLDIYEIDAGSGALRPLVRTPADEFGPVVVKDVLYWTQNDLDDSVVLVPLEGGPPHLAVDNAQLPYWSPDGSRLAFTYGGWRLADWALNLDAGVVEVDADGMPTSPVTPIVAGYHEDFTPNWSPDGRWLAYHSHRSATPVPSYASEGATDDIYLRRSGAPMEEEIRVSDFGWEVGTADWSPDGTRLVFDSWERGGGSRASKPWIATLDPETGQVTRMERLPLPPAVQSVEWEAWSPTGDEIALTAYVSRDRRALWVVSPDGTKAEKLLEYSSSTYGGLDWTPDGETLVYSALAEGRMQLFALPRAGGPPRQLTREPAILLHPQVSPDGRWIACTRTLQTKTLWKLPLKRTP
jgi:Tol biopolymer transport system component